MTSILAWVHSRTIPVWWSVFEWNPKNMYLRWAAFKMKMVGLNEAMVAQYSTVAAVNLSMFQRTG